MHTEINKKESLRRADEFLNQYRELEALISLKYNLSNSESAIGFLLRRPEHQSVKAELDYCREVRNLLTHNPKVDQQYPVEPSEEMIALLNRTIERIKNPKRAKHILIPRGSVSCRTMNDRVYPAMVEMRDRFFTHIPILRNNVVVGVFSENVLLNYLIDQKTIQMDNRMRFSDIADYLPIDKHKAEEFRFISQNTLLTDIEDIFSESQKNAQRIGLLFVTNSGKPTERLLGIISAWDVAAAD